LAHRLAAAGHRVIMTSHKVSRPFRMLDMIGASWRFRNVYDVAHVDVFSGSAFMWAEATCLVFKMCKKPYILTLHGGNLPVFAQRWSGRVRRLLTYAAAITAPSSYLQEKMQPYCSNIIVLPNPLDLSLIHYRLRLSPQPNLLWLRAFHEIYNPLLAVRALARLIDKFPDIHLSMVGRDKGDGALQRVKEEASLLGVIGRLSLPGGVPHNEVPAWIDRSDIFINTTNYDNTPVSVLEAMAGGMCVVSTQVGGIPYLLVHGQDALLIPRDDVDAMVDMVIRVLTEPGLAERLSNNARNKVEKCDWTVVLPQWERLFEGALK